LQAIGHIFTQIAAPARSALFLGCLLTMLACSENAPDMTAQAPARPAAKCLPGGSLQVSTYGALESEIEWASGDMTCEGMQRPNKQGARLRFAGSARDADELRELAFIIALPDLQKGQSAKELVTRVTLIEEDSARFYSTQEVDICWTNIEQHIDESLTAADAPSYRVSGLLYCVAPIAELNGTGSVTLSDMTFSGQLTWSTTP